MTKTNPLFPEFPQFGDFAKTFSQYKMPGVDVETLVAAQRRNIEAVSAANQLAFEGLQAVWHRQGEIMRQTVQEASDMLGQMMTVTTPEEKVAKSAALSKMAFEKALSNMKELAEMVAKSNYEAVEVISARVSDSIEELRGSIPTAKKAAGKR
ncbi:MAG: phasin family protein [Alphaproteobacteria bacterium]|nr:MAG: phasin family protein [Alphaproteobacteria bacterium]